MRVEEYVSPVGTVIACFEESLDGYGLNQTYFVVSVRFLDGSAADLLSTIHDFASRSFRSKSQDFIAGPYEGDWKYLVVRFRRRVPGYRSIVTRADQSVPAVITGSAARIHYTMEATDFGMVILWLDNVEHLSPASPR